MQYKYTFQKKILFTALCIIIFISGVEGVTAVPLPGQYSFEEYEIYPADYEIVAIYDGTELKEIDGWNNLIFWKDRLFAEINTLAERTSTSEIVGTVVLPIASVFLGMCFFVIISRRKSPETDPSSTPAKILRYIEEHPGCLQHQIAAGINKSRGSVAYQLYRLKKEKKVYFAINRSKSVRYYLSIGNASTVRYLMISALENEFQKNILQILHQYPQSTRHQIA